MVINMENQFLHALDGKIVDKTGRAILLKGWGLGNWLVQEGYMWKSGSPLFDRPRRIEKVIEELAGEEYAADFWKRYRENYITREDIFKMAELGYNSVRIPLHYKCFLTDDEEIVWKKEGFALLDRCIEWCEEAHLYAFLDLHAAPGGQTGANIDDSLGDEPRLFLEEKNQEKCIALWSKLAGRYRDREWVGGYDLLNEPIAPPSEQHGDFDDLIPELESFYHKLIEAIRKQDPYHLLSIEGPHWATGLSVFDQKYDDNMVLHFHRYGEIPDIDCLKPYMETADRLGVPLWMGETGENLNEWYTAFYPLAESLGIGYNLWTWKKMECTNSPYSIRMPQEYEKLMQYVTEGIHPGKEKAQKILEEYLENIRIENCDEHSEITNYVLRRVPFSVRATDFDEMPGAGKAYSNAAGCADQSSILPYRKDSKMRLVELHAAKEKRFCFDCCWDRFGLLLGQGEFVCYQVSSEEDFVLELTLSPEKTGGRLLVDWNRAVEENGVSGFSEEKGTLRKASDSERVTRISAGESRVRIPVKAGSGALKLKVLEGELCLEKLSFIRIE